MVFRLFWTYILPYYLRLFKSHLRKWGLLLLLLLLVNLLDLLRDLLRDLLDLLLLDVVDLGLEILFLVLFVWFVIVVILWTVCPFLTNIWWHVLILYRLGVHRYFNIGYLIYNMLLYCWILILIERWCLQRLRINIQRRTLNHLVNGHINIRSLILALIIRKFG